jgi:Tol biopolymer transport system component
LPGRTRNIYVVQANGGKLELVYEAQANEFDPTWSPDGNSLVFASDQTRLVSVDLRTGRSSAMPGSEGMYSPRISPDGRFVVAKDAPGSQKLLLFDQQTRKWSELMNSKAQLNWQQWSNDSKSVFVVDFTDHRAPAFYRIRVADHKVEPVARFEVPDGTTGFWIGWAGIAPDGSPLALRDLSLWEVYALDVDLP